MWHNFLAALALLLVVEGVFPFLSPGRWRRFLAILLQQDDFRLRVMGLISMLTGLFLLYIVEHFAGWATAMPASFN